MSFFILKGDFFMNNFESEHLRPMPFPKPLPEMSDAELSKLLSSNSNYNVLIPALIESNKRKDKKIAELTQRVNNLESKTLKKAGRKRQTFYFNGQELTDKYLEYLIDFDFITIRKLEKDVGAGKNQLRNRYNKIKRQKKLQEEVNSHDHS